MRPRLSQSLRQPILSLLSIYLSIFFFFFFFFTTPRVVERKREAGARVARLLMAAAATKRGMLAEDVPWRALPTGKKPFPKIHQNPVVRIDAGSPGATYALAVMKRSDPIGDGFAVEAQLEAAGPDCLVPGQVAPVKVLGLKVWPVDVNFKFLEPVGRQLCAIGKFMDSSVNLMNASFQDR